MAFKAVIHSPARQEQMQEIYKAAAQYRAEKTAKYLGAVGVNYDNFRECLRKRKYIVLAQKHRSARHGL